MGKRSDLSDFDRGQIVGARMCGASVSETAALVGCSRTTVSRVYQEWRNHQKTSSQRSHSGRPHVVDSRGERRVSRLVSQHGRATVEQLTHQYNSGQAQPISAMTMRRTLHRLGYRSRTPKTTVGQPSSQPTPPMDQSKESVDFGHLKDSDLVETA